MRKVMIGGTGMTRFGKFLDTNLRALAAEAATAALADADTAADEVGMVFFGNAAGGLLGAQECVRGQVALRHSGLLGKPIVNVENACASSSTAFHLAVLAVGSGQCDVALAVGAEKMSNEDRTVPLKALEAAADRDEFEELKKRIAPGGAGSGSVFMDLYSNLARDFAERTGATPADYARVSVKQRRAGALNEKAQFQEAVTVEDVLESRMIAEPLTLMMCSPIGDGAAALVLMSEDYAQRKAVNPVAVLASELRSGQGDDPEAPPVAQAAATAAYETAGLGPEDISVAEIHDAAAPAELMLSEQLGSAAQAMRWDCCGMASPRSKAACRSTRAAGSSARATRSARPARRSSSSSPTRCAAARARASGKAHGSASPRTPAAGSARMPPPPA